MEIIHIVLGKANPERMNGVNKVVHQLATQQQLAGKKVAVWGFTQQPEHNYPARHYTTRLFKAYRNKFSVDPTFINALQEAGTNRTYHLHGGFNPIMTAIAKLLHQYGQPYVVTPHGAYNTIAMQKSWLRKRIFFSLFEKKMLRHANAIHSLGASEVAGLQKLYPNQKSILIPYGYEAAQCMPAKKERPAFVIGFCGRIDIYTKGLDLLLQAFAQLQQQLPTAQLWIIGKGNDSAQLLQMAQRLGIVDHVSFLGSKFGTEKDELLAQLSVFAHPSRNEGLPTAVLEAAAMGIPCVVTQATNMGGYIQLYDAGATIALPDAQALYEALLQVHNRLQTDATAALSANARNMVQQAFNWNKIVNDFDKLYLHS